MAGRVGSESGRLGVATALERAEVGVAAAMRREEEEEEEEEKGKSTLNPTGPAGEMVR